MEMDVMIVIGFGARDSVFVSEGGGGAGKGQRRRKNYALVVGGEGRLT